MLKGAEKRAKPLCVIMSSTTHFLCPPVLYILSISLRQEKGPKFNFVAGGDEFFFFS